MPPKKKIVRSKNRVASPYKTRPKTSYGEQIPKDMLKPSEKLRMTEQSVEIEHLRAENAALKIKVKVTDDMKAMIEALQSQLEAAYKSNEQQLEVSE